ncbi:hypothetical protein X777_13242 [Ooceraea biroi]|uniref:SCP domain-containing protein n=1 Tax=Ooceraea biroi TaxID=2015173 RepID=A0A026VYN9_OOCBI|nr:hypothetical protein X777_13242 [Ooceraea biroi]
MVDIPYGLNVYVGCQTPYWRMSEDVVQNWLEISPTKMYQESRYYKYDELQPRNLKNVRNFIQLVWKDSKFIGVGSVVEPNENIYLVCIYDPPANSNGEFQRNVTLPTKVSTNKNFFNSTVLSVIA